MTPKWVEEYSRSFYYTTGVRLRKGKGEKNREMV